MVFHQPFRVSRILEQSNPELPSEKEVHAVRKRVPIVPLLILVLCLPSCVPSSSSVVTDAPVKSLPPSELAKYCDSFDGLREDLWEKEAVIPEAQRHNFKPGEVTAQGGKLTLETKTGAFSKVSFASKFLLRGDFDVQIDCSFRFLKKEVKMDQYVVVYVGETDKRRDRMFLSDFAIVKAEGESDGGLAAGAGRGKTTPSAGKRSLEAFEGTLRFVRKGKNLVLLCQDKGSSEWKEMNNSACPDVDMNFVVILSNCLPNRKNIAAQDPLSATFRDFKINAAQGIRESGI
jgi:hypothetical protein